MFKTTYLSPLGDLIIISHDNYIIYCNWDNEDCNRKLMKIFKSYKNLPETGNEEILHRTICQLEEYFSGVRKTFDLPFKLTGTEFQMKVWMELQKIGYASSITYKELSSRIGIPEGCRAVANACGCNPLAIILPCHRVVASGGRLGGYTGGVDKKIELLRMESK